MRRLALLAVALSVWTYGSEAMDEIVGRTEGDVFMETLQCRAENDEVYCLVDGRWASMDNRPLLVPWEAGQAGEEEGI